MKRNAAMIDRELIDRITIGGIKSALHDHGGYISRKNMTSAAKRISGDFYSKLVIERSGEIVEVNEKELRDTRKRLRKVVDANHGLREIFFSLVEAGLITDETPFAATIKNIAKGFALECKKKEIATEVNGVSQ
jgi:hypothetical protein